MNLALSPETRELRRQLSLYVPSGSAAELEAVRRLVDPVQSRLIPAHVTLCREDEVGQLSVAELQSRLSNGKLKPITLQFGQSEAFSGHGILLSCTGGQDGFQALREHILGSASIRTPRPHITLAHPRNPKAPGNSLASASGLPASLSITFDTLCLIEQEGKEPWRLIQSFHLPEQSNEY
jgi:2'-5' RNA ligase